MLDQEVLLLLLVFHRVFVLLVALQVTSLHAAPPDVLVQTDLTLEVEVLQELVEIDLTEILAAIEDPLDLEESEEKEDKIKFFLHKKNHQK